MASTKPLYILVSDGGDGSYSTRFTFNTELINKMQAAYDSDMMDYDNGIGCDGDGFHYRTIQVPTECTAVSMGISEYAMIKDDFADKFAINEDEDE